MVSKTQGKARAFVPDAGALDDFKSSSALARRERERRKKPRDAKRYTHRMMQAREK